MEDTYTYEKDGDYFLRKSFEDKSSSSESLSTLTDKEKCDGDFTETASEQDRKETSSNEEIGCGSSSDNGTSCESAENENDQAPQSVEQKIIKVISSRSISKSISRASLIASFGSLASLDDLSYTVDFEETVKRGKTLTDDSFRFESVLSDPNIVYDASLESIQQVVVTVGGNSDADRDNSGDPWGWFNTESVDEKEQVSRDVRDSWFNNANSIGRPRLPGNSTQDQNDLEWPRVLFLWKNPNPSMSCRCSSSNLNLHGFSSSFDMRLSVAIGGYRTIQSPDGEINAEFQFIFCYGSRTFNCWKRFREFKKLHQIVKYAHKNYFLHDGVELDEHRFEMHGASRFPKSMEAWDILKSRQKWTKCLSVVYLIEKSVFLGRFMQALLMESESPGLLVYFSQCSSIEGFN